MYTVSCYHHSHLVFIISDFHHLSHVGERDGGASRGPFGCSQRQSQDQVRRSLCTARSTDDGETASGEVAGAAGGVGETGRGFWSQVRPSQPSYHILAIGRNIIHQHTYQPILSTLHIDQPFHHTPSDKYLTHHNIYVITITNHHTLSPHFITPHHTRGIQHFIFSGVIKQLEDTANAYLSVLAEGGVVLDKQPYRHNIPFLFNPLCYSLFYPFTCSLVFPLIHPLIPPFLYHQAASNYHCKVRKVLRMTRTIVTPPLPLRTRLSKVCGYVTTGKEGERGVGFEREGCRSSQADSGEG